MVIFQSSLRGKFNSSSRWIAGGTQQLRTKVSSLVESYLRTVTSSTAIDRVHRIGQEKTVYVKHFIVREPSFCVISNIDDVCPDR